MSTIDGIPLSEVLQLFQELETAWPILMTQYYVLTSTFVLVFYDYILTLPLEIAEIWRAYGAIVHLPIYLRYRVRADQFSPHTTSIFNMQYSCNTFWHIQYVLSLVQAMAMFIIFSLKIFAIYQKNYFVLICLGTITCCFLSTLLWTIINHQGSRFTSLLSIGPFTCQVTAPNALVADQWQLAIYAIMIFFTSLVFCLAIAKTIRLAIEARRANVRISLVLLILRDGSVYYFIILMLEIADIVTAALYMKSQQDGINSNAYALIYSCFISVSSGLDWILGNRLVLNLSRTTAAVSEGQSFSAVRFATNSILGNIGAPLRVSSELSWDSDLLDESGLSFSLELDDVSTRRSEKMPSHEKC